MAEKVILAEQEISGFVWSSNYSCYVATQSPAQMSIEDGVSYRIVWGDAVCTRVGYSTNALGTATVSIGDNSGLGGEATDDGFVIVHVPTSDLVYFMTYSEIDTVKVAIYQVVEGAGFILQDRSNEASEYTNTVIRFPTADGGTVAFTRGEAVEKTVELDFSGGDMEITPDAGKIFSKIMIPKPENLTEANIKEGEVVAGLVGALAGGANVITAYGSITGTGAAQTVAHNMGVIPDILVICVIGVYVHTANSGRTIAHFTGISTAMFEKLKAHPAMKQTGVTYGQTASTAYDTNAIDSNAGIIRKATTESFTIGNNSGQLATDLTYHWFAIGGLT